MTGKQLVQGCYAVTWVGVEPTTFELQGRSLSTEPRRPVNVGQAKRCTAKIRPEAVGLDVRAKSGGSRLNCG